MAALGSSGNQIGLFLSISTRALYAWNVLGLDARDIALHFGHQDGGELVRKLYGHPDAARARERIREAFRQAPTAPVPLAPPLVPAGRYG
jgi:hypothetical protein